MTDGPRPAALDARRERIFRSLSELNPEFAGYYRTAIQLLMTPALSGDQRAKVSAICNAFREIMNGFASLLGEESSPVIAPSSGKLLSKLPDLEFQIDPDNEVVPIGRDVAIAIQEIVRTVALERARTAQDIASLLAGTPQEGHALLRTWKDSASFFQEWTHWSRKARTTPTPTDKELEARIIVVENIIESRVGAFFEVRHSINDLLADINGETEGGDE